MGEPAALTDDEHARLLDFAEAVVAATRNDTDQPEPRWPDGDAMDEGTMIFKLAQLALDLDESNHQLQTCLSVGNGGPYQITTTCVHIAPHELEKLKATLDGRAAEITRLRAGLREALIRWSASDEAGAGAARRALLRKELDLP